MTHTPHDTLDHWRVPHPIYELFCKSGCPSPDDRMEPLHRLVNLLPRVLSLGNLERSLERSKLLSELRGSRDLPDGLSWSAIAFGLGGEEARAGGAC